MKTIEIIIDERLSNRDIKNILFEHLGFSQRLVTRLKQTDGIRLNGEHATVRKKVILGDILTVTMNDEKNENEFAPTSVYGVGGADMFLVRVPVFRWREFAFIYDFRKRGRVFGNTVV